MYIFVRRTKLISCFSFADLENHFKSEYLPILLGFLNADICILKIPHKVVKRAT